MTVLLVLLQMSALQAGPPKAAPAGLTVMTYNVNFGLAGDPSIVRAIKGGRADVVFLQETTPAWERTLRRRLKGTYRHMGFRHCCRAGGLAVLSRYPVRELEVIAAPTGWFPGWRVIVEAPGGPLQALVVHLHPPVSENGSWVKGFFTTSGDRLREIRHFLRALDPGLPTLVAGDFNEVRGPAIDHLLEHGMRSALHELAPDATTWHWQTAIGELTQMLDNVFYTGPLEAVSARVLRAGRSDHYPVLVRFARR